MLLYSLICIEFVCISFKFLVVFHSKLNNAMDNIAVCHAIPWHFFKRALYLMEMPPGECNLEQGYVFHCFHGLQSLPPFGGRLITNTLTTPIALLLGIIEVKNPPPRLLLLMIVCLFKNKHESYNYVQDTSQMWGKIEGPYPSLFIIEIGYVLCYGIALQSNPVISSIYQASSVIINCNTEAKCRA